VTRYLAFLILAACGGAAMQTVQIVNHTSRPIDELYIYPSGAADHGKSRGKLAPEGSTQLQVKAGFIEVLAVSAKMQLDEHTRDRPSASQAVEVKGPVQIVFYDEGGKPANIDQPGVFGVEFVLPKPKPAEPPPDPAP
jgi:hypothetical protein